jgi:fibronectin-binding autotransporter adhesin
VDSANFNSLNITANSTVTLDGNQTINALNFSDADNSTVASWLLNAGSPPTSVLTLGGTLPTIAVTNLGSGVAVVNAMVAGTNGLTKIGTDFLQLNGTNTYSGTTILSGSNCRISFGNALAFGTGTVQVGANVGDGQVWFNAAGGQTLTNAFEIRTIRWIIDLTTVNGIGAGGLSVNGNVLLNTGSANVRDIFCNKNLTLNGNVSVAPTSNPLNKQGGSTLRSTARTPSGELPQSTPAPSRSMVR